MTLHKHKETPGFSNATYRSLLPEQLAANPNCQQAMTRSLFKAVLDQKKSEVSNVTDLADLQTCLAALTPQVLTELGTLKQPYHTRWHTEEVLQCVDILLPYAALSAEEEALLKLAALFHDFGHSGTPYRQLTEPYADQALSNEEFAAQQADARVREVLSVTQRLELQALILATSHRAEITSGLDHSTREELHRDYAPSTKLERLLVFADVGRLLLGVPHHIEGSLKLLEEYKLPFPTFDDWIKGEEAFLTVVMKQRDHLQSLKVLDSAGMKLVNQKLRDTAEAYKLLATTNDMAHQVTEKKFTEAVARSRN